MKHKRMESTAMDEAKRNDWGIEFGLYHNGAPVCPFVIQSVYWTPGHRSEFSAALPAVDGSSRVYTLRGAFSAELVDNWATADLWLYAPDGRPISTGRPALMFLAPSDVPMTTAFPALDWRPLWAAGIWVVTHRLADRVHDLRRRYEAPAEEV